MSRGQPGQPERHAADRSSAPLRLAPGLAPLLLAAVALGACGSGTGLAAPRTPSAHSDSPRARPQAGSPPASEPQEPSGSLRDPASSDGFGRWDMPISSCQLLRQGGASPAMPPLRCRRVRLDQQLPGLLSFRFIAPPGAQRPTDTLLVFAGVLRPGSPPMHCRDGGCEPRGAMRLQVSAVAETGFQPQGTLLQAQLARGQCLWQESHLRCEASAPNGASWSAEAGR